MLAGNFYAVCLVTSPIHFNTTVNFLRDFPRLCQNGTIVSTEFAGGRTCAVHRKQVDKNETTVAIISVSGATVNVALRARWSGNTHLHQ